MLALAVMFAVAPIARAWKGYGLGSPGTHDLIAYWGAGQLLREGVSPYDFDRLLAVQRGEGWQGDAAVAVWNPPLLFVWLYPALRLPFPAAALAWYALGVVAVAGCTSLIWRDLDGSHEVWARGAAWAAAFLFAPVRIDLHMGQMSLVLLVGVVGFLHHATRGRDTLAGLCLALTAIKPHVVYLVWIAALAWAIRGRRWGFFIGVAAPITATLAVLAAVWPNAVAGYRTILERPPLHFLTPTLAGILRATVGPGARTLALAIPAATGIGVIGYLITRRSAPDWRSAAGPLLLLSVATAPYGWCFDQAVLLVPYLAVIAWAVRPSCPRMTRAVAIAGLMLMNALLMAQNTGRVAEVYLFWTPWALAAIYVYARPGPRTVGGPAPAYPLAALTAGSG